MNRAQKAAVVEEVAAQIQESEAVFAVDYRGISVPQAADLREKLNEAGARFRIVKNTLTELAADRAGTDSLKEVLEGPTAFTFVAPDGGDVALAAKALAQFKRDHDLLDFKGGLMNGEPLSAEQIGELARLPALDVLHGQVVGMIAAPITGLVRGLNALIAGLAIQLRQIAEEGMVPVGGAATEAESAAPEGDQPAAEEAPEAGAVEAPDADAAEPTAEEPATEEPAGEDASSAAVDQEAQADQAAEEAAQSAEGEETESSSEGSSPSDAEAAAEKAEETETAAEMAEETDAPGEEAQETETAAETTDQTETPSEGEKE
jgi:large subunit ribosomal protein L10